MIHWYKKIDGVWKLAGQSTPINHPTIFLLTTLFRMLTDAVADDLRNAVGTKPGARMNDFNFDNIFTEASANANKSKL